MSKLLEMLVARGRRVRRPREQREVAFGLADMSTHPEVHIRMVQKVSWDKFRLCIYIVYIQYYIYIYIYKFLT